jgi:hypothetical protein
MIQDQKGYESISNSQTHSNNKIHGELVVLEGKIGAGGCQEIQNILTVSIKTAINSNVLFSTRISDFRAEFIDGQKSCEIRNRTDIIDPI